MPGALVGGALLRRLGTWVQHLDLRDNASLAEQWLYGNRSILVRPGRRVRSASLVAKRLVGYRERTGDLFAPAVALGMAIGRVGCLLTELPGTPTGAPWGITLDAEAAARARRAAGVPLHPVVRVRDRVPRCRVRRALVLAARTGGRRRARLFTLYLLGYAVFRFLRGVRARQRGRLRRA